MSNLTIEAVPDELVEMASTPEGMALARVAILAAFGYESPEEVARLKEAFFTMWSKRP
jgi:hypothetical protein